MVRYQLAKKQSGNHSTKSISEISGTTKKPFKQKGTGSARAGSAKSPIRRHGGTIFGPVPRSHSFRLNKKTKKLASRSVFAEKVRQNDVIILDELKLSDHKTKKLITKLKNLNLPDKVLIVGDHISEELLLASRNIPGLNVLSYRSLNVYEMLKNNKLVFLRNALESYKNRIIV